MRTKLFLTFAVLLLVGVGSHLSSTAQQENNQESSAFTDLTLEIALTKAEFVPLEPIPILVTLSNATTKTVAWRHALTPNHTELFVVSSGGSPKKIDFHKPIRELIEVSPYPKVLRPGDAEHLKPLITMGLNDILSQPGDYRIQAVTHGANWNEEVRSKPVLVRIVNPQGINEQVFNYIKRASSSDLFAGWDLSQNHDILSTLESVSNDFAESAYSEYASFRLGEFYFYKNEDARAKIYLDRLTGKGDFVFADKVVDYRNKLAARQRRAP